MNSERTLALLALMLAFLASQFSEAGAGQSPPPSKCDFVNGRVKCPCVVVRRGKVCAQTTPPNGQLIWCTANGTTPCVSANTVTCVGIDGAGDCDAFVSMNIQCDFTKESC